jgi:hypothetical protein
MITTVGRDLFGATAGQKLIPNPDFHNSEQSFVEAKGDKMEDV